MRSASKIIGGLFLLGILLVGGAVAYWLTMDASVFKGELSTMASKQLGRTLTISGELKPTFSLSNGFGLRVTGVTLANAQGFQPQNILSIGELELVVDVMAALQKRVHVKKFVLNDTDLVLEARGDANNWTFKDRASAAAQPAPAEGQKLEFAADEISIKDLSLAHIQNGTRKQYNVKSLDLTAADGEPVTVKLAADADGKDIVLDVKAGTLTAIEAGQKQKIEGSVKYGDIKADLVADYRRVGDEHTFGNLVLDYSGIKATGSVALNLGGSVPMVMADLQLPTVDFAALSGGKSGGIAGGNTSAANDAPLFSHEPLPWDTLKSINLSAAIDIKQLLSGDKSYGPANLQAKLMNGLLNATLLTQPPGATKPVTIKTQANASKTLALQIDAPGLDAATLSRWLGQDEPLVQAPARFVLNATGQGNSLHDVMGGANGAMLLDFAPGKLNVGALPVGLSTVLASIVGAEKLSNASVACMIADFAIENGVAKARGLGTAASILNGSGEGGVNLRDETLNLRLVVDARETVKQIPLLPIGITGSLKKPVIAADMAALKGQVINSLVDNVAGQTIVGKIGAAAQGLTGSKQQVIKKPFNPCRPNDKPEPEAAPAEVAPAAPITNPKDLLNNPDAAKQIMKDPSQLLNLFGGKKSQ